MIELKLNHSWWCEFLHFFEIMFSLYIHSKRYGHYGGKCERCERWLLRWDHLEEQWTSVEEDHK